MSAQRACVDDTPSVDEGLGAARQAVEEFPRVRRVTCIACEAGREPRLVVSLHDDDQVAGPCPLFDGLGEPTCG